MKVKVIITFGFLMAFCSGFYLGMHYSEVETKIDSDKETIRILQQLQETSG
ncbi:TPA: hypothetical protein JG825_003517 [Vibrio parahaemolyticus]|uniref:hypothetical protein n=1 Tax=Vibrio TaxID=662 RepID=UPI00206293F2|nr:MULTISPECIES: hypothetical protein [Vibrio]MDK9773321.1 hypothetical protein [Vibrio sp. B181a]UPR19021.1 hypothetical protein H9J99_26095 [Vibrio parahaemolyticus]WJT11064.1 hypothetical protein PH545_28390 [Vibrio harveyi]HAV1520198.1 hypothetical protein [Vibrio parahaemolyticus]HAV1539164.1 hypothetical protein [Vibrio parahaemolyticus]